MKAKEKAKQLVKSFINVFPNDAYYDGSMGKQCALIMVNERLEELNFTHIGYGKGVIEGYRNTKIKYWNEVKTEIEKL